MSRALNLSEESEQRLANPFWFALQTEHAALSQGGALARRYQPGYLPFAGLSQNSGAALEELHGLLAPGESAWVASEEPLISSPHWTLLEQIPCVQMLYVPRGAAAVPPPGQDPAPDLLTIVDVPEMLALKEVAFPGFYGPKAPSLGTYYGVRVQGSLVAMAGERLALPGLREVSAVCTHPAYRGRGFAELLILTLLQQHSILGLGSLLHAAAGNHGALRLYKRLGFVHTRSLLFHHLQAAA